MTETLCTLISYFIVQALPHYQKAFESLASERRENSHKNRYNDIKAFDATRVKLSQIGGDTSSDYINANFIKVWYLLLYMNVLNLRDT